MSEMYLLMSRNVSTHEYHIFINSMPIHKEEVEKSIVDKFRALSGCSDPLGPWLYSVNGKIDFHTRTGVGHSIACCSSGPSRGWALWSESQHQFRRVRVRAVLRVKLYYYYNNNLNWNID